MNYKVTTLKLFSDLYINLPQLKKMKEKCSDLTSSSWKYTMAVSWMMDHPRISKGYWVIGKVSYLPHILIPLSFYFLLLWKLWEFPEFLDSTLRYDTLPSMKMHVKVLKNMLCFVVDDISYHFQSIILVILKLFPFLPFFTSQFVYCVWSYGGYTEV